MIDILRRVHTIYYVHGGVYLEKYAKNHSSELLKCVFEITLASLIYDLTQVRVPECRPQFTNNLYIYNFIFEDCNISAPNKEFFDDKKTPRDLTDDVEYNIYTVYLNFDDKISEELGYKNLDSIKQTKIKCLIPAEIAKKSIGGIVSKSNTKSNNPKTKFVNYKITDLLQLQARLSEVKMWFS
jgi:hypothetical protein